MSAATQKTSILLTADDRTRGAFATATAGLDKLKVAGASVQKVLGAIGIGAGIGLAGLATMVRGSINDLDDLAKASRRAGLAAQDLAGLRAAYSQAGGSVESLRAGLDRLNVQLGAARQGAAAQSEMFRRLGVDAGGNTRDTLLKLADTFERLPNAADRAKLATELFGRSAGPEMAAFLGQGRAAVESQIDKFGKISGVTDEAARAAEKFNDSLDTMSRHAKGAAVAIAGPLVSSLNSAIDLMKEYGTIKGFFAGVGAAVIPGVEAKDLTKAALAQREVNEAFKVYGQLLANSRKGPRSPDMQRAFDTQVAAAKARLDKAIAVNRRFEDAAAQETQKEARKTAFQDLGFDAAIQAAKKAKQELDQIDPFGAQRRQAEEQALRALVASQAQAFDELADMRDYQIAQDEKAAAALGRVRDAMIGIIDPIQRYRDELDKVDQLVDAGLFTPEQAALARLYWNEQMDAAAGFGKQLHEDIKKGIDLNKELAMTFTSAFEDAVVGGKKFRDILNSIAQDITRIFLRKTVTEPIGNALGSFFGGLNLGSIFGGARAAGGPVSSGRAYLVGEKGPELFVPRQSGGIVPNDKMGGRGVIINMNVQASDAGSFRRSMGQIKADLAYAVGAAQRNM